MLETPLPVGGVDPRRALVRLLLGSLRRAVPIGQRLAGYEGDRHARWVDRIHVVLRNGRLREARRWRATDSMVRLARVGVNLVVVRDGLTAARHYRLP